ncbi:MAG: hypothetical protein IID41_16105 [Planctomycetes bacterium]|nr:hypothetical protein [Planctomycetota bacterium]
MYKVTSTTRALCLAALVVGAGMTAFSCGGDEHISTTNDVLAEVRPEPSERIPVGRLVVYTETRPFRDSDITYYPHRPYKIYDETGELVRRVPNHRSNYDEKPTTVELPAGEYFVVPEGSGRPRIKVVIEGRQLTKVDVEALLKSGPGSD